MKSKRTRFSSGIVGDFSQSRETARTRNSHNMAMVIFQHRGQEFPDRPPVRDRVDFEYFANEGFGFFKDAPSFADTSVVD